MAKILFEKKLEQGRFVTFDAKPNTELLEVKQTHSSIVVRAESAGQEADGLIQKNEENKVNLAIKTADCVPFLVLGDLGYGMLHAGWRGIHGNIHEHQLIKDLKPYYFFLGPHAGVKRYEVGEEFKDHFQNSSAFESIDRQLHFDLGKELTERIKNSFPKAKVENCNICTISEHSFHSFRRDQTSDRNWNLFFPLN